MFHKYFEEVQKYFDDKTQFIFHIHDNIYFIYDHGRLIASTFDTHY